MDIWYVCTYVYCLCRGGRRPKIVEGFSVIFVWKSVGALFSESVKVEVTLICNWDVKVYWVLRIMSILWTNFQFQFCGHPTLGLLCGNDPMKTEHTSLSLYCLAGGESGASSPMSRKASQIRNRRTSEDLLTGYLMTMLHFLSEAVSHRQTCGNVRTKFWVRES